MTFQRSVAFLRPGRRLSSQFLFHAVAAEGFQRALVQRSNATAQAGIYLGELANIKLPVPVLPEQRLIAEILDTVDEAIRKTEAIIVKLGQVKQGLLHDLLTRGIDEHGQLRDPDRHPEQFKDSPLGRIPMEWGVVEASSYCSSIADGTHDTPQPVAEGFPLVTSKNLKNGAIDWSGCYYISHRDYQLVRSRSWVESGDLLFGMIGTIGNPVVLKQGETSIAPKNVGIFRTAGDWIKSKFLREVLDSFYVAQQIREAMAGSTQKFVSLGTLRTFMIPFPPHREMELLVDAIARLNSRHTAESDTLAKLRLVKRGLMDDLLTGRVRVTNLLEESAT